jgi:eukaryotic-like serine/threonine-protein kinase
VPGGVFLESEEESRGAPLARGRASYAGISKVATTRDHEVWLASSTLLGDIRRPVVLKRARPATAPQDRRASTARLLREASALSRLVHPAIPRLFDVARDESGSPCLVVEHVRGLNLAQITERLSKGGRRLRPSSVLAIAHRLFEALAAAHGTRDPFTGEFCPIIHLDVSPENVIASPDGFAKLVDFSDSKLTAEQDAAAEIPRNRKAPGRSPFEAPEIRSGAAVGVRADVYSACRLIRDLLVGSADPSIPLSALRPGLSARLAWALEAGLANDPEARPHGAADLAAIVREAADLEAARDALVHDISPIQSRYAFSSPPPAASLLARESLFSEAEADSPAHDTDVTVDAAAARPSGVVPYATSRELQLSTLPPPPGPMTNLPELPAAPVAPNLSFLQPQLQAPWAPRPSAPYAPEWLDPRAPAELGVGHPSNAAAPAAPARRRGVRLLLKLALGLALGAVGLAVTYLLMASWSKAGSVTMPVDAAVEPPAEQDDRAPPAATAGPRPESDGAGETLSPTDEDVPVDGMISAPPWARGWRIFVDGAVVGQGQGPFRVRCGVRNVRVGSAGDLRSVDVPCGGTVEVR